MSGAAATAGKNNTAGVWGRNYCGRSFWTEGNTAYHSRAWDGEMVGRRAPAPDSTRVGIRRRSADGSTTVKSQLGDYLSAVTGNAVTTGIRCGGDESIDV